MQPLRRHRVLRTVAWVTFVGAALVTGSVLALQLGPVSRSAFRAAIRLAAPSWLRVEATAVSGSWVGGLTLGSLRVEDTRSGSFIEVDSARLDYQLHTLWRPGHLALEAVTLAGVRATLTPGPSSRDVTTAAPAAPTEPNTGPSISIGSVVLRRVGASARWGGDQPFRIAAGDAALDSVVMGGTLAVGRWRLEADFTPAGVSLPGEGPWGRIQGRGSLAPGRLQLDTLDLRSPRSRVAGSGWMSLDRPLTEAGAVGWSLEAQPLALADLRGLVNVPAVVDGDSIVLTTSAVQNGDGTRILVAGKTSRDGVVRADLSLDRVGDVWQGRLAAEVLNLDLRDYVGPRAPAGPLEARADGTAEIQVAGAHAVAILAAGTVGVTSASGAASGQVTFRRTGTPDAGGVDSLDVSLGTTRWEDWTVTGGHVASMRRDGIVSWDIRGDVAKGGALSGQVRAQGRGLRVADAEATADVALGPSSIAAWPLDSARVGLVWNRGEGSSSGWLHSQGGRTSWRAELAVAESGGEVRFTDLALDSVAPRADTAAGASLDRYTFDANGRVAWTGPVTKLRHLAQLTGDLDVRWPGGRAGGVPVDSATASIHLERGEVDARLSALLPDSAWLEAGLEGTVADSLNVVLHHGRFHGLSGTAVAPWAPSMRLDGAFSGRMRGSPGSDGAWVQLDVEVAPSAFGADTLRALDASVRWTRDTTVASFRAQLGGGTAEGRWLAVAAGGARTWSGEADLDLPSLETLLGRTGNPMAVAAHLQASGGGGADLAVTTAVRSAHGWGVHVDTALIALRTGRGVVVVDTVSLRSSVLIAEGSGMLPGAFLHPLGLRPDVSLGATLSDDRFSLTGTVPEGATLDLGEDRWETQGGSFQLHSECIVGDCSLEGTMDLDPVLGPGLSLASASGAVNGRLRPGARWPELLLDVTAQELRVGAGRIRSTEARFTVGQHHLVVDASAQVDATRSGRLRVTFDADTLEVSAANRRFVIESLGFQGEDHTWALAGPSVVTVGRESVTVDTVVLASGPHRITGHALWAPQRKDLSIRADSFPLEGISDLAGAPGVGGWIDVAASYTVTGEDRRLTASVDGAATLAGRPLHTIRVRTEEDGDRLAVDATLADPAGRPRLRARGLVPFGADTTGDASAWALDVDGDALPLAWIGAYLPEESVRGLAGSLAARLAVRGPRNAPTVEGPVAVTGASFEMPRLGLRLTDVRLASSFRDQTLTVDTLSARSGGRLSVRGNVDFTSFREPATLDLEASADRFVGWNTRALRSVVTGRARLSGTTRRPRVDGALQVVAGELHFDDPVREGQLQDVELSHEDWATLQARFGVVPPHQRDPAALLGEATALDVTITLGRDIWLRQDANPRMAVQFTGDLRIRKAPEEPGNFQGRLEAIPGRSSLEQFRRRFDVEAGSLLFQGPLADTELDVTSAYRILAPQGEDTDVTIRMALAGKFGDLELALSSEPDMEAADMVSYLATGQPASRAFSSQQGAEAAAAIGAEVVVSEVSLLAERYATQAGLDVLEIRQEGLRGASFVAGKYVTPRLFLGVRQPVSFKGAEVGQFSTEGQVEWRALDWLLANLQASGVAFRFMLVGSRGY